VLVSFRVILPDWMRSWWRMRMCLERDKLSLLLWAPWAHSQKVSALVHILCTSKITKENRKHFSRLCACLGFGV
jgi:hypothetical protein